MTNPQKITQNAYIERLKRGLLRDVASSYVFRTLEEVRPLTTEWVV